MKLLAQTPDTPIVEEWSWNTDIQVSTDGTEQRASLCEYPKRGLNVSIGLHTDSEVQSVIHRLSTSAEGLAIPFYQAATRLTGSAAVGANSIAFRAHRTDMRSGGEALLFDSTGRLERVRLAVVSAAGATLASPLTRAWDRRASVAPIWECYAAGNLAIARNNPDYAATVRASFIEFGFMEPFANAFAPHDFTMFQGYPVLEVNAVGSTFENTYITGAQVIEFGAVAEVRNPWLHSQVVMPRQFLCQRTFDPASWAMWRAFADYAKGSANPFYIPTFRQDFTVPAMPAGGTSTVTFTGPEYAEDFAPFAPYRQLALFGVDDVHYARVTNAVVSNGNSVVTFEPALPQEMTTILVSMLLKVRIADDKVLCEHESLHTTLSINLRTAD